MNDTQKADLDVQRRKIDVVQAFNGIIAAIGVTFAVQTFVQGDRDLDPAGFLGTVLGPPIPHASVEAIVSFATVLIVSFRFFYLNARWLDTRYASSLAPPYYLVTVEVLPMYFQGLALAAMCLVVYHPAAIFWLMFAVFISDVVFAAARVATLGMRYADLQGGWLLNNGFFAIVLGGLLWRGSALGEATYVLSGFGLIVLNTAVSSWVNRSLYR